ncbi:MAG: hypothetical protein LUD84_05090, partial [Clostridiales bacterium]|nr:hypothetical protein [Clostridiales bacterium]
EFEGVALRIVTYPPPLSGEARGDTACRLVSVLFDSCGIFSRNASFWPPATKKHSGFNGAVRLEKTSGENSSEKS